MGITEQLDEVPDAGRSRSARIEPRLLSPDEAATYLGLGSRWAVYRLISHGELHPIRLARKLRLDRRDLDALIDSAKVALSTEAPLETSTARRMRTVRHELLQFERRAPQRSPAKPPQLPSAPRGP